jgi:hypothetical protein
MMRKQNGAKNPFAMSEENSLKSSMDKYGSFQGGMVMEQQQQQQ